LILRFLILDLVVLSPVLAGPSIGLGVGFLSAMAELPRDTKTKVAANLFMEFSLHCDSSTLGSEMLPELQGRR